MNYPQSLGLGELGQRVQAMSDPVTDSRLRPYQGAPLPVGSPSNGRPLSAYEPLEDVRNAPPTPPAPAPPTPNPYVIQPFQPAAPLPGQFSNPAANQIPSQNSNPLPGSFRNSSSSPPPASPWENVTPATPAPESTDQAAASGSQPASSPAPPPASTAATDPNDSSKSGLNRILNAIRSTLPVVQKLLPLIDGNFATAVSALMVPQPSHHPPPQPVQVDMEPVERVLTEVRNSQRELRGVVLEQVTSLKRVEDQLERVREATDRNTLEQQELVEDLRSVGGRVSTFAIVGLVLLLISLGLNVWLLIQLQHILR
jgi:hypothetical protein